MPRKSETANVIAHMGQAHQGMKAGRDRIYGGPVFTYLLFSLMNYSASVLENHRV